ncbi:MAG TPA: cysteine desulfurase-like protein [Gemmatimonadaceae bacterium]
MTATARDPRALGTPTVDQIRRRFPAMERVHGGRSVAYFDGPGGTQVPREVVTAMAEYLFHHNANTHWNYPTSAETDSAIEQARIAAADFFGAQPNEVAFGQNMTTIAYHVSRAVSPRFARGDTVLVTELDHHANIAPWVRLESERGVKVRWVRMNPEDGTLDWKDLERAIAEGPKLVAIGAASNALGTITDVRAVCAMARAVNALTFVDAVHFAPHGLIDVAEIGCDFLACSAYKFYGPHIGILYTRSALGAELDVPKLSGAPDAMPERLETGTQNHEGIVGAAAAIDFLAGLGDGGTRRQRLSAAFEELGRRSEDLFTQLWEGLGAIPRVRRYGLPPGSPRTPTLSFVVEGISSDDVARALADVGLFVSNGDFYATTVVERLGHAQDGVVRAGAAIYTTHEEVERLISAVKQLAVG